MFHFLKKYYEIRKSQQVILYKFHFGGLYFLERNGILFDISGNKRIADNTLVALTLMIAVSKPVEKGTMVKVIVNLINKRNFCIV